MKKGFSNTELIIVILVFATLLFFAVPKFLLLVHKAQEGHTKHELVRVRSAIAAYYGEHEGVYPTDDLSSLVPAYIEKIPQAKVPGFEPSNAVSTGNFEQCFTKKGGWAYVNDPKDPRFGDFFVNVDARDSYGREWQSH
jgi:type II secretory pathway pseudopilin PulG